MGEVYFIIGIIPLAPSPPFPSGSSSPAYLERAFGRLGGVQWHGHIRPQKVAAILLRRFLKAGRFEPGVHRGALVRDISRARGLQEKGVGGGINGVLVSICLGELPAVEGVGCRQGQSDKEGVNSAAAHAGTTVVRGGGNGDGVIGRRRGGRV